jgi:hypothetical protein
VFGLFELPLPFTLFAPCVKNTTTAHTIPMATTMPIVQKTPRFHFGMLPF